MRMTRSSLLEVLRQDYIRSARAKGLRQRTVVYGHALRNSMLPVITLLGLQFGALLGGAVITEAGNHDKVAALVYVTAFAPAQGEPL